MTIRETIQKQKTAMKNRTLKERLSFFWEYYALKTAALIVALVVILAFVISIITQKEYAFTGVFFGAQSQASSENYLNNFAQEANIDLKNYTLTIQETPEIRMDQQISTEIYQSMETFTAMVAAQSVSCFAGNSDLFLYYAYLGYAKDLRTIFMQEELQALAPYLYYVDGQLIEAQEDSDEGYAEAYWNRPADPTKPELMAQPIPVGISLDAASEDFKNSYRFENPSVIGVCESSEFPEYAAAFLRHCLSFTK